MKSVVLRTCYGILSMSREFNLLTIKYDVITGQCNVRDITEKVFTNTLSQVRLVDVYACFSSLFSFSPFSLFSFRCFFTLLCIVLYCVTYCLSGE